MVICYDSHKKPIQLGRVYNTIVQNKPFAPKWGGGTFDLSPPGQIGFPLVGKGLKGHSRKRGQHEPRHGGEKVYSVFGEQQWVGVARLQLTGREVVGGEFKGGMGLPGRQERTGRPARKSRAHSRYVEPCRLSWYLYGFGDCLYFSSSFPKDGQLLAIKTYHFCLLSKWSTLIYQTLRDMWTKSCLMISLGKGARNMVVEQTYPIQLEGYSSPPEVQL